MSAIREPLRVAVYCHAFSEDRDEVGFQRKVIMRTLERCTDPFPIVTLYTDDGFCPDTQVRPDFQRMLLDAATGYLDCIAFCGWDHLSGLEDSRKTLSRFLRKHEVLPLECRVLEAVLVRLAA